MARVFITGSADGLGQMAARLMVADGHQVVLHARNDKRAKEARAAVPGAESAIAGDLSSIEECQQIAEEVNTLGAFDPLQFPRRLRKHLNSKDWFIFDGEIFSEQTLAGYDNPTNRRFAFGPLAALQRHVRTVSIVFSSKPSPGLFTIRMFVTRSSVSIIASTTTMP